MKIRIKPVIITLLVLLLVPVVNVTAQGKAVKSINADELYTHLKFISSDELEGRATPSSGLKVAARYLATQVASYGFKPLMPDNTYLQIIPMRITSVSETNTRLIVSGELGEHVFNFPQAFGGRRFRTAGSFSGSVVFAGYGLSAPDHGWNDLSDLDLRGKVVVMLDGQLPDDHALRLRENRRILSGRSSAPRRRGAAMVLNVISEEREREMAENGTAFSNSERGSVISDSPASQRRPQRPQAEEPPARPELPFIQVEIRHDVAVAILGISKDELGGMFASISRGQQVQPGDIPEKHVALSVSTKSRTGRSQNVVAFLEGSDSKLKDEYVLFGAHYDHLGIRNGEVMNGADDDGSGTVALLEIAEAMSIERPKRSVVIVWHAGEETGLVGARYFVDNSPIPLDKMSAQLNMDMLSRNDPNGIYVIGSGRLSTDLDKTLNDVNNKHIKLNLDYTYDAPDDPNRFYRRSDHYMYAQYGVPVIFFFCGTTEDYHQPTDTIEKCDFNKLAKVTQLVYRIGYEVGNKKELLKLDADPNVTSRGKHNMQSRR